MDTSLLVKLLLVHFTADFLLQFSLLAEGKERHGLRSWHIWVHILIHGVLVHLVLQTPWITAATLITHAAIDVGKITLSDSRRMRSWFFLDQFLHLLVASVIWWIGRGEQYPLLPEFLETNLVVITGLVIVSKPLKYMIGVYLTGWLTPSMSKADPFCQRGAVVGMLERMGTFVSIVWGMWWIALGYAVLKIGSHLVGPTSVTDPERRKYTVTGSVLSLLCAWAVSWMALQLL